MVRHALARIERALLAQRGHLFPWVPVALAIGIGIYFSARAEPSLPVYAALATLALAAGGWAAARPGAWSPLLWAVALAAFGVCLAGYRAGSVAAPKLAWRYYGPVEGRITGIDRSASDALRITLDEVRLDGIPPQRRPDRVRLSLHGQAPDLRPGQRVMTTAYLAPPQGPVEPGGFDFRRHAWFLRLGAVGYTRVPVLIVSPPGRSGAGLWLMSLRHHLSGGIRAVLPGDVGGFGAAVTTGDRSGVSQTALHALRASNLAHLLAISGLHMGLLTGFVFAAVRLCLAAIPALALRLPGRKIAAAAALLAAVGYYALSGGNVATERAFVMVCVVLGAVLVDRRAFSLRAVALAALVVLVLRPETLLGPGFQMSFAATTALIAVFGALRNPDLPKLPRWARPPAAVAISSAVAGAATAPVAAAHFNTLSQYGLAANLLSVPVMGLVVVPAAVLALCLWPFGWAELGLRIMGLGLRWILGVAEHVAALPGAQAHVVAPGAAVLPLLALGALWLILWQGRARVAGLLPALAAVALWTQAQRPAVLAAEDGKLVGVMTAEGRALSKPRGAGFIARVWLENDGDAARQAEAAARWPASEGRLRRIRLAGRDIVHVNGKRAAAELRGCREGEIVVSSVPLSLSGPCTLFDPARLKRTGSIAIWADGLVSARQKTGARLWNSEPPPPPERRAALGMAGQ